VSRTVPTGTRPVRRTRTSVEAPHAAGADGEPKGLSEAERRGGLEKPANLNRGLHRWLTSR